MTAPPDDAVDPVKVMRLRYAGTCDRCATSLDAGARAQYVRSTKSVRCLTCPDAEWPAEGPTAGVQTAPGPAPIVAGTAGASAKREYERRSAKRETRVREAHPRIGGLILALTDEPQSTTAWARGAKGEEVLGGRLDALASAGVRSLHDRRIPRSRANIDHITVGPGGVHVIDAKRYQGRPSLRVEGGILRPRVEKLLVGSRDYSRLVTGVHHQVALVRTELDRAGMADVPVGGVLCFVGADWPVIGGSFVIAEVDVLWPKKLGEKLSTPGPVSSDQVAEAHRALAGAFPSA